MFDDTKTRKSGVLRSEAYLTHNYEPEEPVGQDTVINRIAEAVRPLTKGRQPEDLLVHGPSGVGKTTCVKHILQRLEDETRVKPVHINCWQYNTRSSLLPELLIQLGYPAPRKGKPVDELLSKIKEWLNKNRGIVMALDEFDQLDDQDLIYDLQLLNKEAEHGFGIIMVSNQHPRNLNLDPRSTSRLSIQTLKFNPYSTHQLIEILKKRVQQAFKPGSVDNRVIEEIAGQVSEANGDCRQALEMLLRAGRIADQENADKVSEKHLRRLS